MWLEWKADILRAVLMVLIVAIAGVFINWVRTPLVNAGVERGIISRARGENLRGVKLIDSWEHRGWPRVGRLPSEPGDGGEPGPEEPEREPQVWEIGLLETKELYDSGECVFFDARDAEYYEEGHISGALNWPYSQYERYYDRYASTVGLDRCVVAYCIGGACDESYHLAEDLLATGYREVYLYVGGMEEWQVMGYPVSAGPEP